MEAKQSHRVNSAILFVCVRVCDCAVSVFVFLAGITCLVAPSDLFPSVLENCGIFDGVLSTQIDGPNIGYRGAVQRRSVFEGPRNGWRPKITLASSCIRLLLFFMKFQRARTEESKTHFQVARISPWKKMRTPVAK
jgi:hypothetical protein